MTDRDDYEPPSPAAIRRKIIEADTPGLPGAFARAWLVCGIRTGEIPSHLVPARLRPRAESEDRRRFLERQLAACRAAKRRSCLPC